MYESERYKKKNLNEKWGLYDRQDRITLMATGYIVAPISKLPFLNIMTDVLLTQVPVETRHQDIKGDRVV